MDRSSSTFFPHLHGSSCSLPGVRMRAVGDRNETVSFSIPGCSDYLWQQKSFVISVKVVWSARSRRAEIQAQQKGHGGGKPGIQSNENEEIPSKDR